MGLTTRNVLESDLPTLENVSKSAIKAKQKFERLVLPKETLLEMFNVRRNYPHDSACCTVLIVSFRFHSTTSTRFTSFNRRFPMAHLPLYTDAVL